MMLNTDVAMVFRQNNAMADCMAKAEADSANGKALMAASAECRDKFSGV